MVVRRDMIKRRERRERPDRNPVMKVLIQRAGSVSALARALSISVSAVSQWRDVPPERVIEIEALTGVSRHIQRPDIFGLPDGDGVAETVKKKGHTEPAAA